MAIIAQEIELQTHLEGTTLRLLNVEKFSDGRGYGCDLAVKSGGFACNCRFYFDDNSLSNAIASLRCMMAGAPGEATIRGAYEDNYVRFTMNQLGHIVVSGELYEHSELSQSFKFAFRTDQTVVGPLVERLAGVCGA